MIFALLREKNIKQYKWLGFLSNQLETNKKRFLWHCLNLETGYVIVFQKDITL